jgi:hypothetical protein
LAGLPGGKWQILTFGAAAATAGPLANAKLASRRKRGSQSRNLLVVFIGYPPP